LHRDRLDRALVALLPEFSRNHLKHLIEDGCVSLLAHAQPVTKVAHLVKAAETYSIRLQPTEMSQAYLPQAMDLDVVFEDAHLRVIHKPVGLVVHPAPGNWSGTLLNGLLALDPSLKQVPRAGIVHRLDKETSGLMIFAKTPESKEILQSHWDEAEKRYEAIVEGRLRERSGIFESDLDETNPYKVFSVPRSENTRHAVTHFRVLASTPNRSLVELTLETGRRHQIRVQLAEAGCPIIGDKKYGAKSNPAKRLGLHSSALRFPHPITGKEMSFTCPLPKDLTRLV
jgi:23S rRNA pseudouridine1911/1915/1917 synthase